MRQSYRPEIDGLRAIAVLSVVLYHLRIPFMEGGFTGVDVFFVISGFLITQKIHLDIQGNSFSFRGFYLARVRRILPALIATIAATLLAAVILMSPAALQETSAEALTSILSFSNLLFWSSSGYFDAESYTKPLLHTWSLSVEEQFYLLWPAFLVLASRVPRIKIVTAIATIFLISLAACEICLRQEPSAAFFLTPFRVFEFAVGGMLATAPFRHRPRKWLSESLVLVGLIVIISCVVLYDEKTLFPGIAALWPCLGTAMCIAPGSTWVSSRLLMNRAAVQIGKISYSLYLVHWPIIVLTEYALLRELTGGEAAIAFVACMASAVLLYWFVERPFRDRSPSGFSIPGPKLIKLVIAGIAGVSAISACAWVQNGWTWRLGDRGKAIAKVNADPKAFHKRNWGGASCSPSFCETQPEAGRAVAYVIGDSHARALFSGFRKNFPQHNFRFFAPDACAIYSMTYGPKEGSEDAARCNLVRAKAYEEIRQNPLPIVLAQHWATRIEQDHVDDGNKSLQLSFQNDEDYVRFINQEIHATKEILGDRKILVIGGIPRFDAPLSPIDCVSRPLQPDSCHQSKKHSKYIRKHAAINKVFLNSANPDYGFVNPYDYFCAEGVCRNFDHQGKPLYSDKTHLSKWGSDYLVFHMKERVLGIL